MELRNKSKCVWEDCYRAEVAANFHHKARKRLADHFSDGRKKNKRPGWYLEHLWNDLLRQWQTADFLERSEKGKKAPSSEKGGSLHTGGAISLGTIKRRLYGRPMNYDELFKETHIVKKNKEGDGDRWVEDRAETAYGRCQSSIDEFIRIQPAGESGKPTQPLDGDAERIWLEAFGSPKWGKVYGLPMKEFHRYRCGMQGIGTSSQSEEHNRESLSAMRETVSKLTSELEAAKERERLRDAQFLGMQAHMRTLLFV
ncbi:uncharacterized protein [Nicotiana tomentosiformis]|uniref:uncharacterized protein n=1 Tax=Nicotiana tomentosiformis TaxID=4098 RepID=UPI00388CB790